MRLIGVGVSGLSTGARQLSLWDKPDERAERLQAAIRSLQARFGAKAIQRGALLAQPGDST
ncbi:MAG: hypothetical protein DCC55_15360 [Chloroflexi bacterium]|nr:MAG: hypothetical protein DCC55_15360 [Chloroflexota bacterium]